MRHFNIEYAQEYDSQDRYDVDEKNSNFSNSNNEKDKAQNQVIRDELAAQENSLKSSSFYKRVYNIVTFSMKRILSRDATSDNEKDIVKANDKIRSRNKSENLDENLYIIRIENIIKNLDLLNSAVKKLVESVEASRTIKQTMTQVNLIIDAHHYSSN
ncbi:hypothetical protein FQN54_003815 [Arachnomyces sp. PD_36]|nr:hypothetical protein FQN54_003815 [Arachnomyces sp. PD_36]